MSDSSSSSSNRGGVRRPRPTLLPDRAHLHRLRDVWIPHPIYFITCCVADRHPVLANNAAAAILVAAFRNSPRFHNWTVGRYVIMPDHVHFFARPAPEAKPLAAFVRDWKKWTSRQLAHEAKIPAPAWQPEFFDHVLRSSNSYSEKWEYVRHNPVRAGLVSAPDVWPFSGECELLSF